MRFEAPMNFPFPIFRLFGRYGWKAVGSCLFAAILIGCAAESAPYEDWTLGADEDAFAEGDREPADSEASSDLSGLWAMKFSIAYTTVLPVFNRKVQLILTGIARTETEQDGLDLHFTERLCDFRMTIVEDIDFHITFPRQSVQAIPVKPRLGVFASAEPDAAWHADPVLDIYGAREELNGHPATDPLPTEPDDPLVLDFEGDGNPGVTARITGAVSGEVYVLFRMVRELDGVRVGGDLIEGEIGSSVEMVTLAADPFVLEFQLDLEKHDVAELNRFEFIRLAQDLDCEELFAREEELFDYDPLDFAVPFPDE